MTTLSLDIEQEVFLISLKKDLCKFSNLI